ncbi:hypothetical protein OROGR_029176 [Orobanche gracilis]
MDSMLSNLRKYYPSLPVNIIKRIYRARLERLTMLMRNSIPEDIRWLIEAQVRLSSEFSNSFRYMPGTGKSSFAKKRRAKRLGGCYKCARWTCDTRCKSVGFVSRNREDKIAFIKDGLSKESMDHDIHQILDTHPSGYVHRELMALWIQFKDERKRYSHEKLVSKDPVCKEMEFSVSSYRSHPIKTVCILGGSKLIGHIQHVDMAYQFVKELGKYKIDILYGGSNHRFSGYLLEAAENGRIRVTSVSHFPTVRTSSIGGSTGLMLQAQSVHDNLMYMVNNSDAFIVLPGGYDTLNEIFNITSWAERDFHTKPIGLLNINNFFSDLLTFLDQGVDHKFISQPSRDILICADTVADLLIKFQARISVKNLEVKAHQPQAIGAK